MALLWNFAYDCVKILKCWSSWFQLSSFTASSFWLDPLPSASLRSMNLKRIARRRERGRGRENKLRENFLSWSESFQERHTQEFPLHWPQLMRLQGTFSQQVTSPLLSAQQMTLVASRTTSSLSYLPPFWKLGSAVLSRMAHVPVTFFSLTKGLMK